MAASSNRLATIFIFLTVLLDMVGFGLIIPVQPQLISSVAHVDIASASMIGGWMFFAFSAAQFLFGPTLGNLSDAFGRRPLLLLAVFGLGVDYLITALAPSVGWLFVGRTLAGLCGASYVIANAFISDITPPEGRAKAFGVMGAAFGLGFVIGPALGGLIGAFGPRVPFFVAAGISLCNFILGYFALPETLPPDKRRRFEWARANPVGTFMVFMRYRQVLPLCLVLAIYFFATSVYPAIWPFWATAKFGWGPTLIGITLAVFGITMALAQGFLTGPLVKLLGEWNLALIGLASGVVSCIGYALAPNLTWVVVILLVHTPEGFVQPLLAAILSREVPEDAQGELQGGMSAIANVFMMLGTVFYAESFGYFAAPNPFITSPSVDFYIAAALLGLAVLMLQAHARPAHREFLSER